MEQKVDRVENNFNNWVSYKSFYICIGRTEDRRVRIGDNGIVHGQTMFTLLKCDEIHGDGIRIGVSCPEICCETVVLSKEQLKTNMQNGMMVWNLKLDSIGRLIEDVHFEKLFNYIKDMVWKNPYTVFQHMVKIEFDGEKYTYDDGIAKYVDPYIKCGVDDEKIIELIRDLFTVVSSMNLNQAKKVIYNFDYTTYWEQDHVFVWTNDKYQLIYELLKVARILASSLECIEGWFYIVNKDNCLSYQIGDVHIPEYPYGYRNFALKDIAEATDFLWSMYINHPDCCCDDTMLINMNEPTENILKFINKEINLKDEVKRIYNCVNAVRKLEGSELNEMYDDYHEFIPGYDGYKDPKPYVKAALNKVSSDSCNILSDDEALAIMILIVKYAKMDISQLSYPKTHVISIKPLKINIYFEYGKCYIGPASENPNDIDNILD